MPVANDSEGYRNGEELAQGGVHPEESGMVQGTRTYAADKGKGGDP